MQEHNIASAWFDDLYQKHKENHENIPWARKDVNPLLQDYLQSKENHSGKALVIGCGLGDDAYALSCAGYDVVAIDVSQTAIEIARQRFPDAKISFEKQDIFDMPQKFHEYFDFVFEALTIQSLPRKFREKMIECVVQTLGKDAELLVVGHRFNGNEDGPPWPLKEDELEFFKSHSLEQLSFEIIQEESMISKQKFRILYKVT